jgi:hypothetical protein
MHQPRTRIKRIGLIALLAFLLIGLCWANCPASQDPNKFEVNGHWQGKFPLPDDSKISDADNPVAVDITVKSDAGKLSGVAVFYVVRNKDGRPQVVGKKETELISPRFDGKTLKFAVKSKGQQPGTETTVEMRMTLTSAAAADLENMEDASSPVFKMKKVR